MTPQVTVALLPRRHKGGTSEKTLGLPMRLKGEWIWGPRVLSVLLKPSLWAVTLVRLILRMCLFYA